MFSSLSVLPPDAIFLLNDEFVASTHPKKVNGGVGIYARPDGTPFVFESIKKSADEVPLLPQYLSMRGDQEFCTLAAETFWGGNLPFPAVLQQSCGGTHACALLAGLFERSTSTPTLLLATPTWVNHKNVFHTFTISEFPHLGEDGEVSPESYLSAISSAPKNAVLLLHGGLTHNPTGKNLSLLDLKKVLQKAKEKGVFVFVDFAYFGFGESWEGDQAFFHTYCEELEECAIAFSFSKNAALYQHRTGFLLVKTKDTKKVASNLENIVRETISNPPAFGSHLLKTLFKKYGDDWKKELEAVRNDLKNRRKSLAEVLPTKYSFIPHNSGMFSLLPLSPEEVGILKEKWGIYLPKNGRINIGGIRMQDIPYLGEAIGSFGAGN